MPTTQSDITLIGAGIMSATLGTLCQQLLPEKSLAILEKLTAPALESSHELNNAGTGHAALCELNYTPMQDNGNINISRAVAINEKFCQTLQMWAHWVNTGILSQPREFIRRLPHISFVEGESNVHFLKMRHAALVQHPFFAQMRYSEDLDVLRQWLPLMMTQRDKNIPIAATNVSTGTDINFGEVTRQLFDYLEKNKIPIHYQTEVSHITRTSEGKWLLTLNNKQQHLTNFVFIGCGGGSLKLLQQTHIPESKHIGGFPVSGLFLQCRNERVIAQHHAKVYGTAKVGAPPMSVPHLDTRYINGKKTLLFGPFAGFTPKFLKYGSAWDLAASIKAHNALSVAMAGIKNWTLTRYLLQQVSLSKTQRMDILREFVPNARDEDWELIVAGQRVQIIKDSATEKGVLQFGTEVVCAQDGSLAALLGASPGASTSVPIMLQVLQKCFSKHIMDLPKRLQTMMPSFGQSLSDSPELLQRVRNEIEVALQLADD